MSTIARRTTLTAATSLLGPALGLALAGCGLLPGGGDGPGSPAAPVADAGARSGGQWDRAHLVKVARDRRDVRDLGVLPAGRDVRIGTLVRGVLRVNEAGCYAVGDDVAVGPPGSLALGDGLGVHVPSLGDLRTGDRVEGLVPSAQDARRLAAYEDCLDAGTRGVVVLG